jgi:hydroxymethylbilane synthase
VISNQTTISIASRGSPLALAQAHIILHESRNAFPNLEFEIKTFKTTGDKLQTASLAQEGKALPKGLFTKELETALLEHNADLAVHSLKDLPTELPAGLKLGAVIHREDVRDVLVYRHGKAQGSSKERVEREYGPGLKLEQLPDNAVIATSSSRRRAQLLAQNPTLKVPEIRGNVLTRLTKLFNSLELDGTILARAGLTRLNFRITADGLLQGDGVPPGLMATILEIDVMLPCVGQGALAVEVRENDERMSTVCARLTHPETFQCVTAERAFLAAMGGGCQSPVAAFAEIVGGEMRLRAISFANGPARRAEARGPVSDPVTIGQRLATELKR